MSIRDLWDLLAPTGPERVTNWGVAISDDVDALNAGGTATVHFVARRTGETSVSLASSTFTTYPLNSVIENDGGGSWDATNFLYTVPITGIYLITAGIRMQDNSSSRSTAVGVGTANADAEFVSWADLGGEQRSGRQFLRIASFNQDDALRLFIFSDGSTFETHAALAANGGASGQFMSITLLRGAA